MNAPRISPAEAASELGRWLDSQGCLRQWPTKRRSQQLAVHYLVAKFEAARVYSEQEVNEILDRWAPFRDAALLRRMLIEEQLLRRTPDGREYSVNEPEDSA